MDVDLTEIEKNTQTCPPTIGGMLIMFVMFLLVISDYFVSNTIGRFGKKFMNNRVPNTAGYVVLGLIMVVMHAGLSYMQSEGLL